MEQIHTDFICANLPFLGNLRSPSNSRMSLLQKASWPTAETRRTRRFAEIFS